MSLTTGATLQNQKYVIQKLLHQSDFGVTYQARHAYLEQDVVLQTLNLALRQRNDFQQIRQQFLNKVRSIAQNVESARVLDCFEEGEMPFVVFELIPEQSPPQLLDWFPLMPHKINPLATVAQAPSSPNPAPAGFVDVSAATAETVPPAPALTIPSELQDPEPKTAIRTAVVPPPFYSASARPRSKGWMPIALVSLSMLGGLLGAGFGLSLRLASTSASAQASGETIPKFTPHLFSREQSFPAETDWPISETPQFFTTDPTPVEEPVYRINSSATEDPAPNFPTLPEAPLPSPSLPITNPAAVQATTAPPVTQPITPPTATATELPDPLPIAPAVSEPPAAAQSIPAEPAPPAALPEVPEPNIPDLSVPDAAPAAPALPPINSPGKTIN